MRSRGLIAAAFAAAMVFPAAAGAQQVTGLTATHDVGFTTLKWQPVAGATDYQIERQALDANDQPTGTATIVGVWQPTRTITPARRRRSRSRASCSATRYQWRVRARLGTANPQPYSEPVKGTTLAIPGPESLLDRLGARARRPRPAARRTRRAAEESDFIDRARRGDRPRARGADRHDAHRPAA